jgi:hypothetical protein
MHELIDLERNEAPGNFQLSLQLAHHAMESFLRVFDHHIFFHANLIRIVSLLMMVIIAGLFSNG